MLKSRPDRPQGAACSGLALRLLQLDRWPSCARLLSDADGVGGQHGQLHVASHIAPAQESQALPKPPRACMNDVRCDVQVGCIWGLSAIYFVYPFGFEKLIADPRDSLVAWCAALSRPRPLPYPPSPWLP